MFTRFNDKFGKRDLESITPDEVLSFLTRLTEGNNQTTKRNRYSSLKAFFNYIRNTIDFEITNPCDTPILRKIFREKRPQQWKIIEKDLIDEVIFKTDNPRNRIMMELMAKGGMRINILLYLKLNGMILSGFREYLCFLHYEAGLVPEPAVQLQKMFSSSFCKSIAAKDNDDNNLTSSINASCAEHALHTVA